jgi:hypothetical protein
MYRVIQGSYITQIKGFNDTKFGRSRDNNATVTINVSDNDDIGKLLKELMFKNYPDFYLNIIASSAVVDQNGISDYANPVSQWFNVFYGFYEIDIPISDRSLPYGFDSSGIVIPLDIIRIGLCDWNMLSSYMYGVPYNICEHNTHITGNENLYVTGTIKIGKYTYIEVEFNNVLGTSVYQAKSSLLNKENPISKLLQQSWGGYPYIPGYDIPFPKVRMAGKFYITHITVFNYKLNCFCYKTIVGGGVINIDYYDGKFNNDFLNKQMSEIRNTIILNENIL